MKKKVSLFDRTLLRDFGVIISIIGVVFTLSSFFISIPDDFKLIIAAVFLCILIVIYLTLWVKANLRKKMKIHINNSTVEVRTGDIFGEEGLKVIAFNEYFDTMVDNVIISENSLNGMYLRNLANAKEDVAQLDKLIEDGLSEKISCRNQSRKHGKKIKYKLGTIFTHNNYLLTAFTKFADDNRAYLTMKDYINCLLNLWNEIDIVYAGRSVSIPLLGSGITRIREYPITEQEKLELLIWSFKISRIKFKYPSKVSIIIHDSMRDKINFYKLKELTQ